MVPLARPLHSLALGLWFCMALTLVQAAPKVEAFFNLRLGKTTIPGQKVIEDKMPVTMARGGALGFYYQDSEIVNVARVLTAKGELMLETRSLDPIIWLSTENLSRGTYRLEIISGTQKAEGVLVIK